MLKQLFRLVLKEKKKHNITAREGGIVIAKEYEEAMQLTIDNLIEQEEEDQRHYQKQMH